jgi:hypothetical protein
LGVEIEGSKLSPLVKGVGGGGDHGGVVGSEIQWGAVQVYGG